MKDNVTKAALTRIVNSTYRYRRPPRRRAKAAAIEGPAIVRAKKPKPVTDRIVRRVKPVDRSDTSGGPTASPANDDRKSAIVTVKRPGKRYADVPEMTPEEHRRRGDLADAMFREFKREIAEKLRRP